VYSPKNNTAEVVAESITRFSDAEQARLQELGEEISLQRRQEREITAIANQDANRIILAYDPRFEESVLDLVRGLDQPPPQVMIQVVILEVSMDNGLDLGVEFAFQDLQYAKAGPTDTTTFDYVGGTDIGAAGSGLGGFTFTITGADFNFLLRTLQNEGSLNVLSRPQIIAMDNQEASIEVTNDYPYVNSTSTSIAGQITTSVSREEIGIKLNVTPQINPDGFVRMHVVQEVSDFTGSTVDVGQGVTAPVFFKRITDTFVTVKDGETVVLGGLIQSREEKREQKVPIVGDIPGVGILFRNMHDETRHSELLVILTPRVVRTIEDYRELSIQERDRTGILPDDMLMNPLMNGLRMKPDEMRLQVHDELDRTRGEEEVPGEENGEGTGNEDEYGPTRRDLRLPEAEDEESSDTNSYDVPLTRLSRASR
jgi:general secretion pathway protein D